MFTNQMRMSGFSGLDVADMVTQMMRAESFRLNRFTQQRQILTWQQESIRSVANNVMSFRNNFTRVDALTGPTGINNPANFRGFTANITNIGGGNTNGINITTTPNAASGNHTISVTQEARSDAFRGQRHEGSVTSNQVSFSSFIRSDGSGGFTNTGNFGVNINGTVRQINLDLRAAANAGGGNADAIQALDNIQTLQTNITNARNELSAIAGTGSGQTGFTLAQMTAEGFDVASITDDALRLQVTGHLATINTANSDIADYESDLQNNEDFTQALASQIETQLAGFGPNASGTGNRATVSFEDGSLVISGTVGNTVNIQAGVGASGVSLGAMGFDRNTTNFNVNQSLGEFMGLQRYNNADGSFSHWLNSSGQVATPAETTFNFSIQQGGHTANFSFDVYANENLTIQQVMTQVNNNSELNVRMAFDQINGSFTMESTQTGAANAIEGITDTSGVLSAMFNPTSAGTPGAGFASRGDLQVYTTRAARDAIVTVNGSTTSQANNNFTIDGMNITINAGAVGQEFNVNMQGDTNATRQMIMDFVEAYNNIVREIQDLSNTPRPRQQGGRGHFMPLTDEQRSAMSEREIEQWEEQARTGILHRDQDLRALLNDMRNEMSRVIELEGGGTFSLADMGIRLSPNAADGGILTVNESALNDALQNNMDAVVAMFTGEGASGVRGSGATGVIGNMGISARLDAALNRHVNGFGTGSGLLEQRAGRENTPSDRNNAIHHRIAEQDRRIETMMRFLERRENQLFAQFSRMEQAMMQANSQMGFLDQFIWGGM